MLAWLNKTTILVPFPQSTIVPSPAFKLSLMSIRLLQDFGVENDKNILCPSSIHKLVEVWLQVCLKLK